ncbi:SIA4A sialyltransferase, partial [Loxia curvirostra]|uniref:CMP-N-acetylneuraminate-beta-galactosamide-alpha-2,3-sialyltransferase 1 n=3 Tax=Carduelinae TaxID=37599 RepID=A0A8C9N2P6_SERCA|nr:CMP-N-acetylneuraminate-beta-galactosamide-alpha-2,3-sialyltransferase 1 [Serinus canaria]XP_050826842.1 CMP-N-acetylneuraminate-beta-galactosamide-alpha-2,3-sialyltransferase 1 [Serinus canaria]NWY97934.1 SIA4A sialyltransferase [Loxia curvirostra]NXH06232.1 SIA4A sialyltransferase [Loxia leucoptera]
MVVVRRRNVKVFTFAFLLITVTSFLLNYTHQVTSTTWDPRHLVVQFSEHVQKLFKYPRRPCSCHSCISELGRSLWFDQRFNSTMQPFLTSQNALIPEDSYRWWLKLQGEKAPKSLNATLAELFGVIPGDGDPLQERGSDSCRRCAVVGNSGNLRQSQYGQDIDSHDFVLRMNRAPTAGYESDVGSKTTHHFVYPESYRELAANVSMILIPFKTLDLRWVVTALTTGTINFTYVPVPRKIKVKKEKILVYNPAFMKYIYENWLEHHGRYPSTGLLSLMFALHVCDEVNVYGFGADSKGHWHHYWENNTSGGAFRKTGVHDGDFEFNITLTLASIEKIKFFKGR